VAKPIIAMLTDFGTRDHYAGSLKGVVLTLCPDVTIVDISHDIPPHDILTGALELAACYRVFPAGTIFLAVVDPGVGSSRRVIAASAGGYRFVAPDNGILGPVLDEARSPTVVELREPRYALCPISRTFEGRDRLAPAAAWLARGVDLEAFGPTVADPKRVRVPMPTLLPNRVEGVVLRVDRFGNLVTNIDAATVTGLAASGASPDVEAGGREAGRLVTAYGEVEAGRLCGLIGSSGYLEVAVNQGSAAAVTGLGRGAAVCLVGRQP
jgi:hypothetical protein